MNRLIVMSNYLLSQFSGDNIFLYFAIGLASLLEGPVTILTTGVGISLGTLYPLPAYLSVVIGNLIADLGWYGLGRFGKVEWLHRIGPKFGVKVKDIKRLRNSIQEQAPRMLFLSKFAVGLPIPTLIAIGLNRIPKRRWILPWLLGEALKSAILITIGYFYASEIQKAYGGIQTILWIITILLIVGIFIYFKVNSRKRQSSSSLSSREGSRKEMIEYDPSRNERGLVLIPAYNAEKSIADVVQKARQYLPVLVVDDGSIDHTAAAVRKAGAMLLTIKKNQGKGNALRAGFQKVIADGYGFVITLDADRQHDADEIPDFIKAFHKKNADLIVGERDFSLMPPARRFSNMVGTWMFSWAVRENIPDNQSGYRLISRRLMQVLCESDEQGYEFEVEMITKCVLHHYKMRWIPIKTIYGDEKSHIHPLLHIIKFIKMTIKTHRLLRESFDRI